MRAIAIKAAATWSGEPADSVVLDYDDRHRRRMAMTGHERTSLSARSAGGGRIARRRCAGAGRRAADRSRRRAGAACSKSAAPIRCISRASPGIWATGICRRNCWRKRCASAAITSSPTWLRGSARASSRSRRRSIRKAAPMPAAAIAIDASRRPRSTLTTHGLAVTSACGDRGGCAVRVTSGRRLCRTRALYRLMTWLSPAYPVGAFSYSSGIEWAVEAGDITDVETLRAWLEAMLSVGRGHERRHLLRADASRRDTRRRCRACRNRRARRGIRADARAPSTKRPRWAALLST